MLGSEISVPDSEISVELKLAYLWKRWSINGLMCRVPLGVVSYI